jgi:TetR/AcrR family transcriptional regulator, transcriptional repressor for nem operon
MARIVKEKEYAEKRSEILDVAQRMVYTKGYEQMTIQDILDGLQISKGAFYHYFDSKQAVLEALIERMTQEGVELITPVVKDPELPALEKFARFFNVAAKWKADQKPFMMAIMRVWYADDNALVRQKVSAMGVERVAPLLSEIIRQGIAEKVFMPTFPDLVASVAMVLLLGMGDAVGMQLLSDEPADGMLERIVNIKNVYTDAVERLLGTSAGTLNLADIEILRLWIEEPSEVSESSVIQP